jgi:hypothetical protein
MVRSSLVLAASSRLTNTICTAPYTNTGVIARAPRTLVEDYAYLVVDFFNIFFPPDVQTNSITIDECAFEYNGQYIPVTFSGSSSVTIAAEQVGVKSDFIYPWKIGIPIFPKGAACFIRYRATVPASGKFPGCGNQFSAGNFYRFYNKATTTFTPVMQAGSISQLTGTDSQIVSGDNGTGCLEPVLAGLRSSTGNLPAVMTVGDSLFDGQPVSYVMAAANAAGQACLEFSHGSLQQLQLNAQPAWTYYLRYTSELIDEMGTNALAVSGTESAAAGGYWLTAKNTYGVTGIYFCGLYPRSSNPGADGFATVGGQSPYFPAFVANYDSYMDARVSDGTLRGRFRTLAIRSAPADSLWVADGTANKYTLDGIHPTSFANGLVQAEFIPVFNSWMSGRTAPTT